MTANVLRHIPPYRTDFEFCELFGSRKPATVREYKSDLAFFNTWLDIKHYPDDLPIPPAIVKEWMDDLIEQRLRPNTIRRRKSALYFLHEVTGHHCDNPIYHVLLRGIGKTIKQVRSMKGLSNKPRQKEPLTSDLLKKMVKCCSKKTLIGLRNRALLMVGFASAMRRSELCQLQWSDIMINDQHSRMTIIIQRSKTDKYSEGQVISVSKGTLHYCPIKSLLAWQQASCQTSGFIFRSMNNLNDNKALGSQTYVNLIKECCEKIGLDPSLYSGHSTRRGMLVTASNLGTELHILKSHARHQNSTMTEHYIGDAISNRNNPTNKLFK